MKKYWELFVSFFKVGLLTFGGGYAMLPMLQREVVEKRGWITEEQILDCYAIGQCTPGVIAVNTATFVGFRQAGVLGAAAATVGVVAPSLLIISALAGILR
ncbi:MAG: chromate transporter, partial [Oscillospiraceae bacterium]|nr:chromate transporter [Oscillospiraceae bacterium]